MLEVQFHPGNQPPPSKQGAISGQPSVFYGLCQRLMENPGVWATVSNISSSRVTDLKKWALKRGMIVEATLRNTNSATGRGDMWVRYVGPKP